MALTKVCPTWSSKLGEAAEHAVGCWCSPSLGQLAVGTVRQGKRGAGGQALILLGL